LAFFRQKNFRKISKYNNRPADISDNTVYALLNRSLVARKTTVLADCQINNNAVPIDISTSQIIIFPPSSIFLF